MERLQYKIDINAPAAKVTELMLGKDTYKLWTAEFEPTSDSEGSWGKGDKIYFTGTDEEGKRSGLVSDIAEHIAQRFVSSRHDGILDKGKEITEGEQVEEWAGGFENYTDEEKDCVTTVAVDLDTTPDS